jgi:hypothetical protein
VIRDERDDVLFVIDHQHTLAARGDHHAVTARRRS